MPLIDMPEFSGELLEEFAARRTSRVNTPVIQPAEPFLDMAGEDLRRRIFMTESETGESLCLRPEFTIPVCLRHIETASVIPISAKSSASAGKVPTSFIRPASRILAIPISPPPMPAL